MSSRTLSEWSIDGPTTLSGSDDDAKYLVIRADINDPDNEREVALVGAWDLEGQWNAQLIAAAPKMYAACRAVTHLQVIGGLAEAARTCSEALAGVPEAPRRLVEGQDYARTIRLPCYGITIRLTQAPTDERPGAGTITSDLHDEGDGGEGYGAATDALEALVLAHACAGIEVESPAYIEGIETAVEAIENHVGPRSCFTQNHQGAAMHDHADHRQEASADCRPGYTVKRPFDRDQVAFVAQCVLEGARMLIEDGLPTGTTLEERAKAWGESRVQCLSPYERGALEGAGTALSILFAQLTGEGMGGGDALACADDFHEAIERMMDKSWRDQGAAVMTAVRLRSGTYRIEEIIPDWPDCRRHASHFADVVLEALRENRRESL